MADFKYVNYSDKSSVLYQEIIGNINVYRNDKIYYQIRLLDEDNKKFLYLIEFKWYENNLISANIINEIINEKDYKEESILAMFCDLENDVKKLKDFIKSFERRKKIFNLVK